MPKITDPEIDFLTISFLKQEEASAAWLANRIGITRDQTSSRLRSLRHRGLVSFNRVAWRYNDPQGRRTHIVSRV